ncbi:MAG: hypothetical protein ACOC7J_03785 [Armatimonadota bacterium]
MMGALEGEEHDRANEMHPLRRLLGPTEEPVEHPGGTATWMQMLDACEQVECFIRDHARVPAAIDIEGDEVGPGQFFVAMARMLEGKQFPETVVVPPVSNLPEEYSEGHYDALENDGWPLGYIQYQDDKSKLDNFEAIRRHAKWQYWTFRVATKTK